MAPNYEIYHGPEADRRATSVAAGFIGTTPDTGEMFYGSPDAVYGRPVVPSMVPRHGVDSRRLWGGTKFGTGENWVDDDSVSRDGSGYYVTPQASALVHSTSVGTYPIASGYIAPYELADGGEVVIQALGRYKPGWINPTIRARLKIGGTYRDPQYELQNPSSTTVLDTPAIGNGFLWCAQTCGANALGGYDAANLYHTQQPKGEFIWHLDMRLRSLGRYAKWPVWDDDVAPTAPSTPPTPAPYFHTGTATAWIEATLTWGLLNHNPGGRIAASNAADRILTDACAQYNVFLPAGAKRGTVYSFLGRQWLCHAASATNAIAGSAPTRTTNYAPNQVEDLLAEEAPGMGAHWREFFIPAVQQATFSAFPAIDWTIGNEIVFEMCGPMQGNMATAFSAHSGTAIYSPEVESGAFAGIVDASGTLYGAKVAMDGSGANLVPRMVNGAEVNSAPAPPNDRYWRVLAADRMDRMTIASTQAYLFGGRPGYAQRRVR